MEGTGFEDEACGAHIAQYIERELPKVREEIRNLMEETKQEITVLEDN